MANKKKEFDFETIIDRRGTSSLKWDRYGGRDIVAMWVADMDFKSPPAVLAALKDRIDHGILGYTLKADELEDVVVDMLWRKYAWRVERDWLVWLPGLVCGLNLVCRAFGQYGDEVASFVPIYPPFLSAPRLSGRKLVTVGLKRQSVNVKTGLLERLTFDIDDLDALLGGRTSVLLLCNPHNPVGRVYGADELREVAQMCVDRNVVICSDEVHSDLILDDDASHVPTATLSDEIGQNTITFMSASKTYNIAGLNCAFAVIPNGKLREQFVHSAIGIVPYVNTLGYTASLAAYKYGQGWMRELLKVLRSNRDYLEDFVANELTGVRMEHVEGTYLAWLNVLDMKTVDFERAGVGLSDGREFGGNGYVRLNFGCPKSLLDKGLKRIKAALDAV